MLLSLHVVYYMQLIEIHTGKISSNKYKVNSLPDRLPFERTYTSQHFRDVILGVRPTLPFGPAV